MTDKRERAAHDPGVGWDGNRTCFDFTSIISDKLKGFERGRKCRITRPECKAGLNPMNRTTSVIVGDTELFRVINADLKFRAPG